MTPDWLQPVSLPLPFGPWEVNVYAVCEGGLTGILDSGLKSETAQEDLWQGLRNRGLNPGDIGRAVFTHYHADHCGMGLELRENGVETVMSETESTLISDYFMRPEQDALKASFYGRHPVPERFAQRVSSIFPMFRRFCPEFRPDRTVMDGDSIDLGGIDFKVLVRPGHTQGSLCLWHEETRSLLCGDQLMNDVVPQISLRPDLLDRDPLGSYLETLDYFLSLEIRTAWPGHGRPVHEPRECILGLKKAFREMTEKVLAHVSGQPENSWDICMRAFPGEQMLFGRWIAFGRTLACLCHLRSRGLVEEFVNDESARKYGVVK